MRIPLRKATRYSLLRLPPGTLAVVEPEVVVVSQIEGLLNKPGSHRTGIGRNTGQKVFPPPLIPVVVALYRRAEKCSFARGGYAR